MLGNSRTRGNPENAECFKAILNYTNHNMKALLTELITLDTWLWEILKITGNPYWPSFKMMRWELDLNESLGNSGVVAQLLGL